MMEKENTKRYAALHEFHSGTPAKRPYFDDWRHMLSCAGLLARWFTEAEEHGECIGLIDEKKLKFGIDDGRVQYDGCDVTQLYGVTIGKTWSELKELKTEDLTWAVTQFLPPELFEKSERDMNADLLLDRYQLPVLLFKLFFGCHPICWNDEIPGDAEEWLELLKTEGSYRFAEDRKLPEQFLYPYASGRWNVFPSWFKDACAFTFTVALNEPERRHSSRSWLDMVNAL